MQQLRACAGLFEDLGFHSFYGLVPTGSRQGRIP
jgi:hypothetical protein